MRKQTLVLLSILFLSLAFCGVVSAADGDVIYVNGDSGNDLNNGFTPDNAKKTISNGINNVNPNGVVNIADGTYTGAGNTEITINKSMNINGQSQTGTIIDAQNNTWIFKITYSITVTISQLTLTNGNIDGYGGAIYNQGQLTCNNCQFTNNNADLHGGAIYNRKGVVTCTNCQFTDNNADWHGGAIFNDDELTCTNCQFTNNTADIYGGAIYNYGNVVTCTNCQFTDNNANHGGAINNYNGGVLTCTNCQFTDNNADDDGGAIYNFSGGEVNCTNCQFTDNNADDDGGAIYNSGALTVIGSNLENNKAGSDGGAIYSNYGDFTLNFNRIIGNTADGDGQDINDDNTDPKDAHDALFNWWGSNADPAAGRIVDIDGLVEYDPWLVMRYNANPATIIQGETSTLTADFRYDSDGTFHNPAQGHLPDGTPVTFTTNLGNVGSKSVVKYTLNGVATAILRGDEAAGAALTSATLDNQTLYSTVTIKARTVEAATTQSTTIGMQKTGAPLAGIVLALLMVLGGFISTRKKQ